MKINRIYIKNFGSISEREYKLSQGLNVIFGQNESGKSTFLSFIRFIFYGAKKKNGNVLSFFNKYMPWNGEDMSGEIEFTADGTEYFLSRSISATGRKKEVTLINKTTGDTVPAAWDEVGTKFFKLSEPAFLKTLFLGAEGAQITSDGELLSRISNVAQSGDENVSYQAVRKEITDMIGDLISTRKRNPLIPHIEKQLEEAKAKKAEAERLYEHKSLLAERLAAVEERLSRAIAEKSRLNELAAKRKQHADYSAYEKAPGKLKDAEDAYRNAERDVTGSDGKYDFIKNITPQEEQAILKDNSAHVSELTMQKLLSGDKAKSARTFAVISALLAVICAAAGVFYPAALIGAAAAVVLTVYFIFTSKKLSSRISQIDSEISKLENDKSALLNKYNLQSPEQYQMLKRELADVQARDDLRKSKISMARDIYEERKGELDSLISDLTAKYGGLDAIKCDEVIADEATLPLQIRAAEEEILVCTADAAGLKSDAEAADGIAGELSEINGEIEDLNAQRLDAEESLRILNLAAELLDASYEELKSNFAPRLARATADIFNALTGGKYGELIVNDTFEIKIKNGRKYENSKFFSSGTIQQLYFSLRLGIIELIMGNYPLFIDDAFITYDDARFDNAAGFLKDYSENNQIVFCTCHQRESSMRGAEVLKF